MERRGRREEGEEKREKRRGRRRGRREEEKKTKAFEGYADFVILLPIKVLRRPVASEKGSKTINNDDAFWQNAIANTFIESNHIQ